MNLDEDQTANFGYQWIGKKVEKTWDQIIEDEERGLVLASHPEFEKEQRRVADKVRKGLTRFLYLILDCSKATESSGFSKKISFNTEMVTAVQIFIHDFFDQNPLSQLGIIVTRNSVAVKLTELSGNAKHHIEALNQHLKQTHSEKPAIRDAALGGQASLQNSLTMAHNSLRLVPKYGHREILVCLGSLTSCDPGNVFDVIGQLAKDHTQCSVIGHNAEVYICKYMAQKCNGTYFVAKNYDHFKDLLLRVSPPPPEKGSETTAMAIQMGFPTQEMTEDKPTLCVCHKTFKTTGYRCPRCFHKYCDLPADCQVCGLTLVSASHLARSYHHLFPVQNFEESAVAKKDPAMRCNSCLFLIHRVKYTCPKCKKRFCEDCEDYIHSELHNCPFCD